tara:strand:+ start:255 stop:1172 length:918 start_codon:yes stop_codon:yes gene_type:complete
MKKVFTNSMVAHVWAQQNQPEGRNSGSSIFFEGATIYSYGKHFPMASFKTNAKEETCILVNSQSYSITTSQHQSLVRQAIPLHYKENNRVFYVSEVFSGHETNLKCFKEEQKQIARKITRARSAKAYLLDELRGKVTNANHYCEFFDIQETFALPDAAYMASIKSELKEETKQAKEETKQAKKEKIERLRRVKIESRQYVKEFMRKETARSCLRNLPCILLRLNNDLVQSSQGAEMPVKFAKSIWQMVKHCKSEKVSFTPNGKTLQAGHFQIDSIAPNGDLKAGCHFIKYGMVKSIARQLNLLEA